VTGNGEGLGSGIIKETILVMGWRDGGRSRKIMIISSPTEIQMAKLQNRTKKLFASFE
jgi:hypothetical protein